MREARRKKAPDAPRSLPIPVPIKPSDSYLPMVLLASLAFLLYFNTAFNAYALDDGLVITDNAYTMKGFAGIPGILTRGAFAGVTGAWGGDLSGGRYRPLSMVTFAIEKSLFGLTLPVSHLINVLLYSVLVVLLYRLLQDHLFPDKRGIAFLASLIFVIHPVHTEVVANLKSRDELLALMFIIVVLQWFFRYWNQPRASFLGLSLAAFVAALLSKETAITCLAVIPLTSYVFMNTGAMTSVRRTLPYGAVAAVYLILRSQVVGSLTAGRSTELMNNPFLFATDLEAFCTKVVVLGKYLLLLAFPHPLSYDYSYRQIPYAHVSELRFLLALAANAGLVLLALALIRKRNVYAYAILFYFVSISIVSNVVFDIGATMGERFLFQPSVGFAIAAGVGAYRFLAYRKTLAAGLAAIVVLAGSRTVARNMDWKDNFTLFSKDIQVVPNSAKANENLAIAFNTKAQGGANDERRTEWFEQAIAYSRKATAIYPSYADGYITTGIAFAGLGNLEAAEAELEKARAIQPGSRVLNAGFRFLSQLYLKEAVRLKTLDQVNIDKARALLERAVYCDPANAQALFNLGGVFYTAGDVSRAREYWNKTLALDPTNQAAAEWLRKTAQ